MSISLSGKSAIVTGAGGGINLAYAVKLLESGTNVLIADLKLTPEGEQVVRQYPDHPKAVFQETNVASWKDLNRMFQVAVEQFGEIDIVCPGAGIFEPPSSSFWNPPGSEHSTDHPEGDRYAILDINVTHPIRVAQMAISHFLSCKPKPGPENPKRLIFIASIAGETAFLTLPLYHASKWAIMGFIRTLASAEESFGIKVGGVAPGIVKTRLWTDWADKTFVVTDPATGSLQESWITPEEVADTMLALTKDTEIDDGNGNKIPLVSGTILEVAAGGHVRDIPLFGNAGPPFGTPGMIIANMEGGIKMLVEAISGHPSWGVITQG